MHLRSIKLVFLFIGFLALNIKAQSACTTDCNTPVGGYGLTSLLFDPTTQVKPASLNIETSAYDTWQSFTVEAYIHLANIPRNQWTERPIAFKGAFNPDTIPGQENNGLLFSMEFLLDVSERGTLRFRMGGDVGYGFDLESDREVPLDQWVHVAVSVNYVDAIAAIYIQGEAVGTQRWLLEEPDGPYRDAYLNTAELIPRRATGRIQLGLYQPLFAEVPRRFNGRIDEVRIWSRWFSNDELKAAVGKGLLGDEQGLLSYHPLNEGSGINVTSPWPASGSGYLPINDVQTVPTVRGRVSPYSNIWASSELAVEPPHVPYIANTEREFVLYGIVPASFTPNRPSRGYRGLSYEFLSLPANGTLFHEGIAIDREGLQITGDPNFPVLTWVPDVNFFGTVSFEYKVISTVPRESRPVTVTLYSPLTLDDYRSGCDNEPFSQLELDECNECGGNGTSCAGCDGVPNSGLEYDDCEVCNGGNRDLDVCGVCFGNGTECLGCDRRPWSGLELDECGVCGGNGDSCRGCDGVPGSGAVIDDCGYCGENNERCPLGCDGVRGSGKEFDACNICGGDGSSCAGCDGVPQADPALRTRFDECGVCGGNGTTCADCDGIPNGPNPPNVCGSCEGDLSCLDCNGCPFGTAVRDACGECGGNNSTCKGCDGIPNSGLEKDICGECGGNGTSCIGCDPEVPWSEVDACGECNGDNSTCMCVYYRDFSLARMDCVLLEFTSRNTLNLIEDLLSILDDTQSALDSAELGDFNDIIGEEIRYLNDFTTDCADGFCATMSALIEELVIA
ncbi:Subtilisin-like serine peptidase [Balamuthia mandrillaris]